MIGSPAAIATRNAGSDSTATMNTSPTIARTNAHHANHTVTGGESGIRDVAAMLTGTKIPSALAVR
jgi:hypothetical protein